MTARVGTLRALVLLLLLGAWSSRPALAEGDENERLGITVAVDPVVAIPAAMVKVSGKTTALGVGPMILAPIIVKYDLPFTKAQKLLFRAMSDGPVEIPVEVTSKTMTLAKAFTRKRPGDGNVVDYTLNIKACNPGCK